MTDITQQEWDAFYHVLRKVSVSKDLDEQVAATALTAHLTSRGGNYAALLDFLAFYGTRFIAPRVKEQLRSFDTGFRPRRIVEIGAGIGWLGRELGEFYEAEVLLIDKRPWTPDTVVIDVEAINGMDTLLKVLNEGDLVVCCELIHCLEESKQIELLRKLTTFPTLIVEYDFGHEYSESYLEQISSLGASRFAHSNIAAQNPVFTRKIPPYVMYVM